MFINTRPAPEKCINPSPAPEKCMKIVLGPSSAPDRYQICVWPKELKVGNVWLHKAVGRGTSCPLVSSCMPRG